MVLQYLIQEFKKKSGTNNSRTSSTVTTSVGIDLSQDMFALQRLREGAEKAKKDLDHVPRTEINLPFIYKDKNFSHVLTKDKFEELIKPLVRLPCIHCTSYCFY